LETDTTYQPVDLFDSENGQKVSAILKDEKEPISLIENEYRRLVGDTIIEREEKEKAVIISTPDSRLEESCEELYALFLLSSQLIAIPETQTEVDYNERYPDPQPSLRLVSEVETAEIIQAKIEAEAKMRQAKQSRLKIIDTTERLSAATASIPRIVQNYKLNVHYLPSRSPEYSPHDDFNYMKNELIEIFPGAQIFIVRAIQPIQMLLDKNDGDYNGDNGLLGKRLHTDPDKDRVIRSFLEGEVFPRMEALAGVIETNIAQFIAQASVIDNNFGSVPINVVALRKAALEAPNSNVFPLPPPKTR